MVVAAKYAMLQSPGALHHLAEIVIVVDGSAYSRVVIQKLIPRHLQKKKHYIYPNRNFSGLLWMKAPRSCDCMYPWYI